MIAIRNAIRLACLCTALGAVAFIMSPARSADSGSQVDTLARDVERTEAVRAVKDLQAAYSQYAQYGLWSDLGALFAGQGEWIWGADTVKGPAAIAKFQMDKVGGGKPGLPAGVVNSLFVEVPLVNLSADGNSAQSRWYGFHMLGGGSVDGHEEGARWESGTFENTYVKENGKWKISRLHFFPQFAGPYEKGWEAVTNPLPLIPYHFKNEAEAGTPIPAAAGPAPHTGASLAGLEKRIDALNAQDKARNLQNAYGYYIDRKMWDDVTDLFTSDGVLEVGGVGLYSGAANIRRSLEREFGPAGLKRGQLNDHPLFDTIIEIAPNGMDARVRGMELGMIGDTDKGAMAQWTVRVYDNRFVKQGGVWKIREMRIFPLFKSDYYQGWGKSRIVDAAPAGQFAPDKSLPAADSGDVIPAFLDNPVTGQPVSYPAGAKVAARQPLLPALSAASAAASGGTDARLAEANRKLAVSKAYDGAMNMTAAYTYYIDDGQWSSIGAIFAEHGNKEVPFNGYYIGPERIAHRPGAAPSPNSQNPGRGGWHWLLQPVIDVAPDGRSAKMRTRLFHPAVGFNPGGGIEGGMYPNNQAVLENGIWKLWSVTIDEPYFSASFPYGWSKTPPPRQFPARPAPAAGALPVIPGQVIYPPNIPEVVLGKRMEGFAGGTGETVKWPGIINMWFHYKNPVSGRVPEHYWPDCGVCEYAPYLSMDKYGYTLPPS